MWSALGLRPDGSIQTKKRRVLVSLMGVLSNMCTKGRPWEAGDSCSQGLLGESYQELTFACDSVGCMPEGSRVSLRPPQATWQTKWLPRQQYHGVA